jgi:hypothetical protein
VDELAKNAQLQAIVEKAKEYHAEQKAKQETPMNAEVEAVSKGLLKRFSAKLASVPKNLNLSQKNQICTICS